MRRDIHDAMRAMHGFPGGGGGGRRGRMFDGDELRLVMLKLIADEPRHGYDLIREIETMTGGGYAPSPGVIYPSLTMLGEMGMIDEEASAGVKKRFAATAEGRAHLAENADQVAGLIAKLSGMGDRAKRGDRAPVRRALGNLRHVVQDRLMYGDLSDEQVHDVAAMIDELVQRIERLK
ncbi:PadR family transcriptional regulator [Sphingomonas oligophenolica]|uniref:PadR family transcriptional regulator n=2 Tax=Sphingomonas oligophenolica TaxID=301154 RepID=A0A502CLS7_9SPHN|nr:PadR family transcriptional regulator [Sphingomonas oligophenolica]